MLQTVVEALGFSFFQRALLVGSLIALIYSQLGVFVVIRKETVITHSIGNFAFLGVALGMLLSLDITLMTFVAAVAGVLMVAWLQINQKLSKDSTLTFSSQVAMAMAIIVISLLEGYRVDLLQFLFGNILAIGAVDVWASLIVTIVVIVALAILGRPMLRIALNTDLAKVSRDKVGLINLIYLLLLAVAIAVGIKTVGVILIAAFLVIPANIAKLLAKDYRSLRIWSMVVAILGVVFGLFFSYFADLPSGATIVAVLGVVFLVINMCFSFKRL